jgi:hypothetical protein
MVDQVEVVVLEMMLITHLNMDLELHLVDRVILLLQILLKVKMVVLQV